MLAGADVVTGKRHIAANPPTNNSGETERDKVGNVKFHEIDPPSLLSPVAFALWYRPRPRAPGPRVDVAGVGAGAWWAKKKMPIAMPASAIYGQSLRALNFFTRCFRQSR